MLTVSTRDRYAQIRNLADRIDEHASDVDLCFYEPGRNRPAPAVRVQTYSLSPRIIDLDNAAAEIAETLRCRAAQLLSAAKAVENAAG